MSHRARFFLTLCCCLQLVGVFYAPADGLDVLAPGEPGYQQPRQPFPVPAMTRLSNDLKPFEYVEASESLVDSPSQEGGREPGAGTTKMQMPLLPAESMKHMVVPQGFHVELFAAEPEIGGKPVCMAWDERGRLWIAETTDYPDNLQPDGMGRDRIRILEDTDGDWRADKFTVFADNLSVPTSIAFYRGGAIVQNGAETLYLKDTNGDDVADRREVLFTGWGIGDTHAGVSNFQYGLDNWIWATQGYNESHPIVQGQPIAYSFRQGFLRFRPEATEIEFLRSTDNNTWGLGISEEGIIFGSTANRSPSVCMLIPNRYYERVKGWTPELTLETIADSHRFNPITDRIRQVDNHGGYTAAAGHALYTAREYPKEYWNRSAFVNDPTGHLLGAFILRRDGSSFHSSNSFNLLASDDEWTAPIMAEVGPDGQMWVIDWYNYIVQHNPLPSDIEIGKGNSHISKLRDKKRGRIYRVVYGSQKKRPQPFSLADATSEKLIDTLSHPTMLWRKHAQRLLVERGNLDVVPRLTRLASDQSVDAIGLNVGAIHALWTLHGLGQLDGFHRVATAVAITGLRHPSSGVRRNALQVLPPTVQATRALLQAGVLDDSDAQVRLVSLLALADLPPVPEAGPAILNAFYQAGAGQDRWMHDAAISAAANNVSSSLNAFARTNLVLTEKMLEGIRVVAEHYGRMVQADQAAELFHNLAETSNFAAVEAIVDGLARGWPTGRRLKVTESFDDDLSAVLTKLPEVTQWKLLKLASIWGSKRLEKHVEKITEGLLQKLDNKQLNLEVRIRASRELVEFRAHSDAAVSQILERITPQKTAELDDGLLRSLTASESPVVGALLIKRLPSFTPQTRKTAISVLLQRPQSTTALLNAIDDRIVLLDELSLDQKQSLTSSPNEEIRNQATHLLVQGGALPNADRQKVLTNLMDVASTTGNAKFGKQTFVKQCAKCHMHSGEGAHVGPDLTGVAALSKADLLTQILDPNRSVESNYRSYVVLTDAGKSLSGLLASESNAAIELIDVEGKRQAILREDIEEISASGLSLMPEGFEKELSRQDLSNLLEFLTQRGSFEPMDISQVATVTSSYGMFTQKRFKEERLLLDDWSPRTVAGVPFQLVHPRSGSVKNVIALHSGWGEICRQLPRSVKLSCETSVRTIHLLSGVSAWGFPSEQGQTISLIVRITYVGGEIEDHPLHNGIHFSDFIRRVDVPKSQFAFEFQDHQQVRYLAVHPRKARKIHEIEFIKGPDNTSPLVLAVTLERP